ncbi:MAG: DUF4433 domain-containing protein [Planctomycetes bacterium]|nr:DUF4433 domain-containing protein [Planctomycetota bacterium]
MQAGALFSDVEMGDGGKPHRVIGMGHIKERRLRTPVPSVPGLKVGECVPFYFCPRSVMLYTIHKRNTDIAYHDGQESVLHLVAELPAVVAWAEERGRRVHDVKR